MAAASGGGFAQERRQPRHRDAAAAGIELAEWPVHRPADWVERVNRPDNEAELAALRLSLRRGRPYGSDVWQRQTVERFGLEFTLRPTHRPTRGADLTT